MRDGRWLSVIGVLLLATALLLTGINRLNELRAGQSVDTVLKSWPETAENRAAVLVPDAAQADGRALPVISVDEHTYIGILTLPDKSLPVLADWSEELLQYAPGRYSGTAAGGDLVIAGHNYESHFADLSLLDVGDEITFFDAKANNYEYTVSGIDVLNGTDTCGLLDGDWDLTLFTCTYSGLARSAVRCRRIP